MGLLDRWSKKKDQEKLKDLDKKSNTKVTKTAVVKDEKKSEVAGAPVKPTAGKLGGISYRVLVKPLITEKAAVAESNNKYSFVVSRFATKDQIKQAVFEAYGVEPKVVNVANINGRRVRFGRHFGRRGDYRKAIITLPKGQTISIHEGV